MLRRVAAMFVMILLGSATASTAPLIPLGVSPTQTDGYDWASRENHTHLKLDGRSLLTTVYWDEIETPWMDVEVTHLVPGHLYQMLHTESGNSSTGRAAVDGTVVFWDQRAYLGTYTVQELEGLSTATTLTVADSPELSTQRAYTSSGPTWRDWCSYWGFSCGGSGSSGGSGGGSSPDAPKPVGSDYDSHGWVAEQAAFSNNRDIVIKTTTCTSHFVKVAKWVSGGQAGIQGTAGADYSYTKTVCDTVSSTGSGSVLQRQSEFQKDTYADESYAIYERALTNNLRVITASAGCGSASTVSLDPGKDWSREVTESGAGGVSIGGEVGGKAFGVGLGVSLWQASGTSTKVLISIRNPSPAPQTYQAGFVAGDQVTTGMIGLGC